MDKNKMWMSDMRSRYSQDREDKERFEFGTMNFKKKADLFLIIAIIEKAKQAYNCYSYDHDVIIKFWDLKNSLERDFIKRCSNDSRFYLSSFDYGALDALDHIDDGLERFIDDFCKCIVTRQNKQYVDYRKLRETRRHFDEIDHFNFVPAFLDIEDVGWFLYNSFSNLEIDVNESMDLRKAVSNLGDYLKCDQKMKDRLCQLSDFAAKWGSLKTVQS